MPPQVGEQIAAGDEAEKLITVHDNGDTPPIEYAEQIINFRGRRKRFQLIGHRLLHLIIKMRSITMDLHQNVGFIDDADYTTAVADYRQLRDIGLAHPFES